MTEYTTEWMEGEAPFKQISHLPCPYHTDVEKKAWSEGYASARQCEGGGCTEEEASDHRTADNKFTSGDTMVAFNQGHDDFSYHPVAFNPMDINADHEDSRIRGYIDVSVFHDRESRYSEPRGTYLIWSWTGGNLEGKPEWADNRPMDRGIPVTTWGLRSMVSRMLGDTHIVKPASIDLPCPPYEYDYSEGGMSIKAGAYTKWGEKDDWQKVITEMQEKLDEAPDGLNIEDCYIEVNVTVEARTTTTISIPLTSLVDHENDVYTGTMEELESDAENYLSNMSDWEYEDYIDTGEIDWGYAPVEMTDATAEDVGYDIRNSVTEA